MKTFDIGAEVLVINNGGCYSTYDTFFKREDMKKYESKYAMSTSIPINEVYTVLAKAEHDWSGRIILVLGDSIGNVYLITEDDKELEEVRKEK